MPRISTANAASRRSISSQRAAHARPVALIAMLRAVARRSSSNVESHQHVIAQRAGDDVAPLDQDDAVGLEQLGERQIGDLVMGRQPVDVGVVQRHPTGGIAVHEGVRRRRDRLGHADRLAEALGERGLAGAHLAGEHDEVARRAKPASDAAMADVVASESERRCNMAADDARGSRRGVPPVDARRDPADDLVADRAEPVGPLGGRDRFVALRADQHRLVADRRCRRRRSRPSAGPS